MKKFLMFFCAFFISAGAWAVDEVTVETALSGSVGKLDWSAYEKEIYDEHSNRWSNYELGMELGTDLKEDISVYTGFEYYEARASKEDSSMTYAGVTYSAMDWLDLKVIYRYHWNQEDTDSDDFKYGAVLKFDLPFDISITDCNYFYSRPRRNSHSYLNEFDLSKQLYAWGDENSVSLLLGEEIEYSFDTDLLQYAQSSVGLELAMGAATASVQYHLKDNYHNAHDTEAIEICLSWDF